MKLQWSKSDVKILEYLAERHENEWTKSRTIASKTKVARALGIGRRLFQFYKLKMVERKELGKSHYLDGRGLKHETIYHGWRITAEGRKKLEELKAELSTQKKDESQLPWMMRKDSKPYEIRGD